MSKRTLLTALLVASLVGGQLAAQAQETTSANQNRVETELLKTIVFLTAQLKPAQPTKTGKVPTLHGTGFFVGIPETRLTEVTFVYIVTNRHVAEAIEQDAKGNCAPQPIDKTYVTMNLREPVAGKRSDQIDITPSPRRHWYFPKDTATDLAVMPFSVDLRKYDVKWLELGQFLDKERLEKLGVVAGDKVLTSGYFTGYEGLHEIQPIIREGVLAMLPDGPMTTTTCRSGDLYLADVHVIPGNSGSPLFIIPGLGLGASVGLGGVPNTFGLLGVVSGYMREDVDLTLKASTTWKGSVQENSGIAAVVPAQQLKDLLQSPEIQRIRDEEVERVQKSYVVPSPRR